MAVAEYRATPSNDSRSKLRLLVVSRKVWPIAEESALRLMHWVDHWKTLGVETQILTARWNKNWPGLASVRGVPIHRLVPPPSSHWNEGAFQRSIVSWVQKFSSDFDALYIDSTDGILANLAQKCKNLELPFIVRVQQEFQPHTRPRGFGSITTSVDSALRQADAIVTPSYSKAQSLAELGISKASISLIPDLIHPGIARSANEKQLAGNALFHASSDFVVPGFTDLAIHFGDSSFPQLQPVLKAVCDLLDRGHPIRMWLVGIRQDTSQIYEWIKLRGWHREILLFDGFDVLDDVIQAADLAIVSNPQHSLQYSTNLLLQSAIPTIVAESPTTVEWMPETPLLKKFHSAESLTSQLHDWIGHRQQWNQEAIALRSFFHRHYPFEHALERWNSIFQKIATSNRGRS